MTTTDNQENSSPENSSPESSSQQTLKATPLWALHKERRAKMVPFAGYEMPVQYRRGIIAEHKQTRERAGLFDVSHMGQAFLKLEGEGGHEEIAAAIETLVPGEIKGLKPGGMRYTLLLNDDGGILDDLMITRPEGEGNEGLLFLVVNAATKDNDFAYISEKLEGKAKLIRANDRALLALQGPRAAKILAKHAPFVADMGFMTAKSCRIDGIECIVSRCGYTGEDGFEISVPNEMAEAFARKLIAERDVSLIGLGARDSLRLEVGLCLYGHDIDETTTPAEAGLVWAIGKRRKIDKDFPGAEKIMGQVLDGAPRRRVGILPTGRAPAREGADIVDGEGKVIGKVTSGGHGPTVRGPIAIGYVDASLPEDTQDIGLIVRGQTRPARIVSLPFIEQLYYRAGEAPKRRKAENAPQGSEAEDDETAQDDKPSKSRRSRRPRKAKTAPKEVGEEAKAEVEEVADESVDTPVTEEPTVAEEAAVDEAGEVEESQTEEVTPDTPAVDEKPDPTETDADADSDEKKEDDK